MAKHSYEALKARCDASGQAQLLSDWGALSEAERAALAADLEAIDFDFVASALKASLAAPTAAASGGEARPAEGVLRLDGPGAPSEAARAGWRAAGLRLIAEGRAAVLLLAGGQGTRLGSAAPKGCYDIGLPSRKSLFALQAERLLSLQRLAAASAAAGAGAGSGAGGGAGGGAAKPLMWYVMTSKFTHDETLAHFRDNDYFGLSPGQVFFFQQGFLPCLTEGGQVILEAPSKVAKAPDGNGGLYRALRDGGALADMTKRGVEALDVYCVDNALARVGDPEFLGACWSGGAEVGARVLAKAHPEEKVGVFASDGEGRLQVLEYSELDPEKASATDPATGTLFFNWSNVCMHYFSLPWLARTVEALSGPGAAYHIARKAIPSKGGKVPGIKLEMFIFDPFPTAARTTLFEVARADHFAPVKNAPGADSDTPAAARAAVLAQGARWAAAAGAEIEGGCLGLEIPPALSYAGEGLGKLLGGKPVAAPGPWLLKADGTLMSG